MMGRRQKNPMVIATICIDCIEVPQIPWNIWKCYKFWDQLICFQVDCTKVMPEDKH